MAKPVKLKVGAGKGKAKRSARTQRRGTKKFEVKVSLDFTDAGDKMTIDFDYDFANEELLDSIATQWEEGLAALGADGEATQDETLDWLVGAFIAMANGTQEVRDATSEVE
jgi:hypothetical protein